MTTTVMLRMRRMEQEGWLSFLPRWLRLLAVRVLRYFAPPPAMTKTVTVMVKKTKTRGMCFSPSLLFGDGKERGSRVTSPGGA